MVDYCPICTFPYEYCEFGGTPAKCKSRLQESNPELYQRLYSSEPSKMTEMNGDALVDDVIRLKLEKALKKDMTREEIRAEREKKKLEEARVRIKAVQRQGKKQVTLVTGLDLFGIDLKKAAKTLASKFACSCTVAKNAALEDEVLIQGDVIEDVADYLVSVFPVINESQIVQEARKRK